MKPKMGTSDEQPDFSALDFEKNLVNLKDSQESIHNCCQWCLANRKHYKKIVSIWLNVIKRVKIEQRLTLFYLANDVVQYSKRRNYDYVDTWGTAIQKATTLVRDEKVKHKILRIFKIWEQRGVYGEDFIADLSGLISVQPTGPKGDETHEFQSSYVITKVKSLAKLEKDTDEKQKLLKNHNPKIILNENLITSLKDRANMDDVEKEMEVYEDHMTKYVNALKLELKHRIALISLLKQANTNLEADRKDVKMVAHAYKTYGQRVTIFKEKLEEHIKDVPSPVPSPDINAPSPSPEEDLELPEDNDKPEDTSLNFSDIRKLVTNPGFYVPPPTTNSLVTSKTFDSTVGSFNSTMNSTAAANSGFISNGFSSFLDQNVSFDMTNMSATGLFSTSNTQTTDSYVTTPTAVTQAPVPVPPPIVDLTGDLDSTAYNPLLPPPLPPFTKNDSSFSFNSSMDSLNTPSYEPSYAPSSYNSGAAYSTGSVSNTAQYDYSTQGSTYQPTPLNEPYNPPPSTSQWENADNLGWNEIKGVETPESPPMFEKEGYGDPVEYHDTASRRSGAVDIDQRIIPGMEDLDDSQNSSIIGKDIDHRNLISLTGSPSSTNTNGASQSARSNLKTVPTQESLWDSGDKDYRQETPKDKDYRLNFNLDVPPPPPPPPTSQSTTTKRRPPPPPPLPAPGAPGDPRMRCAINSPRREIVDADDVDMDLSDDLEQTASGGNGYTLEPPPLPSFLDDVGANQFLDDLTNDFNDFNDLSAAEMAESNQDHQDAESEQNASHQWSSMQPPPMNFNMGYPPPPPAPATFMQGMNQNLLSAPPPPFPPSMPSGNWMDHDEYYEEEMDDVPTPWNSGMNFRGGYDGGFRGGNGFRPRGRGRGFRGRPRGGRGGNSPYRRNNFRGGFNRGGF